MDDIATITLSQDDLVLIGITIGAGVTMGILVAASVVDVIKAFFGLPNDKCGGWPR